MDASMPFPRSAQDELHQPTSVAPCTPPLDPPMDVETEERQQYQFTYELKNWWRTQDNRVHSPWHCFGHFKWRLLIFPRGNQVESDISVYLECGGVAESPNVSPAGKVLPKSSSAVCSVAKKDPSDVSVEEGDVSMGGMRTHNVVASSERGASEERSPTKMVTEKNVKNMSDDARMLTQNSLDNVTQMSPLHHPQQERSKEPAPPPLIAAAWSRPAKFWLQLLPNSRSSITTPISKEAKHTFREKETDWGFREYCRSQLIHREGFEDEKGSLHFRVRIRLEEAEPDSMFTSGTYDSRKMTGYVGFKNQGATCYMNSLLQTLYMLGAFRRAVYEMPLPDSTDENVGGSKMSYALQKVFYELQYSSTTVKTKKLTESFGWDNTDAFTQHDVQELNRIMCDHLEERMKKISADQSNTISQLFEGKILNYIECVNVDYKSNREESFYDLSLNVKGCRNIYESFDKYCEVETMDGDNKYRADGFTELQEAKKGVLFLRLPPLLQLHLKRFEYDFNRDAMVKINDRFEYPTEIDLSPYVKDSDGRDIYLLHSVLVHVGDVNGGHYYAYIRPTAKRRTEHEATRGNGNAPATWYKFDDDFVTAVSEENAVCENYGSGGERDATAMATSQRFQDEILNGTGIDLNTTQNHPSTFYHPARPRNYATRRLSNAYMLQYIRKDQADKILTPTSDSDVPKPLADRINSEREEEERRKRDHAEQHLYMTIAVASNNDLAHHNEDDLVSWEKVRHLRVKRAMLLRELKTLLHEEGLVEDANLMRLWRCGSRKNHSIRPVSLLADGDPNSPITETTRDVSALHNASYHFGYQTRQYAMYNDDTLKVFVEDFRSPYCFGAGRMYSLSALKNPAILIDQAFDRRLERVCDDSAKATGSPTTGDVAHHGGDISPAMNGNTDPVHNSSFKLVAGEMILFFKRYVPKPVPSLEYLGHCVLDRKLPVKAMHQVLVDAVASRRERFLNTVPLEAAEMLRLYEEYSAERVHDVDQDRTFESQEIPLDSSKGGDIIVFMSIGAVAHASRNHETENHMIVDKLHDRGFVNDEEALSDGLPLVYNPNLPLGGRSLPTPVDYYKYLLKRIRVDFKNKYLPSQGVGGTSAERSVINLELLRDDTYASVRHILASAIGRDCDPNHLRLFPHDFHKDGPMLEPVRNSDFDELQGMLPVQSVTTLSPGDCRTLWYEHTEYAISEYDHKEEVRITWRPDGGTHCSKYEGGSSSPESSPTNMSSANLDNGNDSTDTMTDVMSGAVDEASNGHFVAAHNSENHNNHDSLRSFSILVPLGSKYDAVISEIRQKVGLPDSTEIRLLDVRNCRVARFLESYDPVSRSGAGSYISSDYGTELRAEPVVPEELSEEVGNDTVTVSVAHIAKEGKPRSWRGPSYFGVPIILRIIRDGETVGEIRQRIRKRLGLAEDVFSTWKLAEICQAKVTYLEDNDYNWTPEDKHQGGLEIISLAIEHYGSAPTRKPNPSSLRFVDKPLKIRG